jgi:hypothetical protein
MVTRNELIASYLDGGIDREAFVGGLNALGFSTSVATAMADRLGAAPGGERSSERLAGAADASTPTSTLPFDVEDKAPTTALPKTGTGSEMSSGTGWIKPAALLVSAAVLVAVIIKLLKREIDTEGA